MLAAAPLFADAWKASLTPNQQQRLQNELDDLHRQAQHEQKWAAKDVKHPEEVEEMQKEYARKEAHIYKEFQSIAANNAVTVADAVMLAAAPLKLANDWEASLTPKQQQRLQNELNDVHK